MPFVCEPSDSTLSSAESTLLGIETTTVAGGTDVSVNPFYHSYARKLYYTLISVVLFFLPVSVMIIVYVVIICHMCVHRTPGEGVRSVHPRRRGTS